MNLVRMGFSFVLCFGVLHSSLYAQATPNPVLDSFSVPEGLVVEQVASAALSAYPMFINFDDAGHLFVCESTGKDISGKEMAAAPECLILRLVDDNADGIFDRKTIYADTLSLPMGMLWHNGDLFVASPPDLLRFRDTDDDGIADEREVLLTGWNVLNTASLHGPFLGPDAWLYLTHGRHGYSIDTKEGTHLEGLAARIWRCRTDGTGLERFAGGGFDNPVELIFTPAGEMLGTMTYFTNPRLGQRDALMHFVEGGVYPKPHECIEEFVRTGDLMPVMTKFSRIAPAGFFHYQGTQLGAEYKGNLFSAQFNPHRIQRHVLERENASFRTVDTDFLTSSYDYFYPTDLTEDADGTLLLCDTGAWYVDACPISRVSLPEIKGGIYRIKNKHSTGVNNPWGLKLQTENMPPEELVSLLGDERLMVQKKALDQLVSKGKSSIGALNNAYQHGDALLRNSIVKALWRIGDADCLPTLRTALNDPDLDTRILAIKALGALQDKESAKKLQSILAKDEAPVQRDAARTLGKIGDATCVPALLEAAAEPADRFVDHAIIYALIQLGDQEQLRKALMHDSPGIRKSALIALDQMDNNLLKAEDITPFLFDENEENQRIALWVASRHIDWADSIASMLENSLSPAEYSEKNRGPLKSILLAYSSNNAIQTLLAHAIQKNIASGIPQLALEIIEAANVSEFPEVWTQELASILSTADHELLGPIVKLINTRNLSGFSPQLSAISLNPDAETTLRLNTLYTLAAQVDALDTRQFSFIKQVLSDNTVPVQRQHCIRILNRATLTHNQKLALMNDVLPGMDELTLAQLLGVFYGESDPGTGKALLNQFENPGTRLARVKAKDFDALFAGYPEEIRQAAAAFRPEDTAYPQEVVDKFKRLADSQHAGDVGRGRRIFFSEKAACSTCHAVGEEGGTLGPDLTSIGAIRNRNDLLESVLFPSANILQDYPSVTIELEWESYAGIIAEESQEAVTLRAGAEQTMRIPRGEIVSIAPSDQSLMPDGLDATLSDEEMLDLLAFLMSLNNEQWLLPQPFEGKEH